MATTYFDLLPCEVIELIYEKKHKAEFNWSFTKLLINEYHEDTIKMRKIEDLKNEISSVLQPDLPENGLRNLLRLESIWKLEKELYGKCKFTFEEFEALQRSF